MISKKIIPFFILIICGMIASATRAGTPQLINYQGYIKKDAAPLSVPTNMNFKLTTTSLDGPNGPVPLGPVSSRVLVACAILCSPGSVLTYPADEANSWNNPANAVFNGGTLTSPHLNQAHNPYPDGGNRGYLDGHAGWLNFRFFICRAGPPTAGAADFFW